MRNKNIFQILAIALILGIVTSFLNVKVTATPGTIYIRPDGSIDPSTAPIQRNGDLYTIIANISDSIVIQRNNMTIDGSGYKLQGTGSGYGFDISYRSNITIKNTNVIGFSTGIYLYYSDRNTIIDGTVGNSASFGIYVGFDSDYNNVISNTVSDSKSTGIMVYNNNGNNIQGNMLSNNTWGNYPWTSAIWLEFASGGTVTGNIIEHNIKGGIFLYEARSVKVAGNTMRNNGDGIGTMNAFHCNIAGNTIHNNTNAGISFGADGAVGNIVENNIIQYNRIGIFLEPMFEDSTNNITSNTIANNNIGLELNLAVGTIYNNYIYHNNFLANTQQLHIIPSLPGNPMPANYWDSGYPSGGNYWSDYTSTDLYNGPYQNIPGSDGIGDNPIIIDQNNADHYPLMNPYENAPYALTITSTSGGTTDPVPETYFYTAGSTVTITAIPTATYLFDHWKLDNVNAGSSNPISVTIDANHALHAIFRSNPDIAVTKVLAYPTSVRQGQPMYINVTVDNNGLSTATFDIVVHADRNRFIIGDEITIGTQAIYNFIPGATKTIKFTWDTTITPAGGYYISGKAIVSYDLNPTNNLLTSTKKVSIKR